MKKLIYTIAGAALLLCSCSDDYLERLPDTKIPATQAYFNSESGLQLYSNNFYAFLDYGSITADMTSDNCEHGKSPNTTRLGNWTMPTALGSNGWSWGWLRDFNYFIEHCSKSNVASNVKNEYNALAKFFRAWFYFDKVKSFGDVPWYSTTVGSGDEELLYKGRDSRTMVMDSVLADLNYAVKYLPATKYRNKISKYAALALKSRICLFEGTYRKYRGMGDDSKFLTEAADAAKELMDSQQYKLYSTGNPDTDYRQMFQPKSVNLDENILVYSFADGVFHHYSSYYTVPSLGQYSATRSLIEDYFMKDGRTYLEAYPDAEVREKMTFGEEISGRDPRLAQSIITPGYIRTGTTDVELTANFAQAITGYQITKRVGKIIEGDQGDDRDVILIRYAEVLLNYAEAKAELGSLTQADVDQTVNELHKRVGIPARTFPLVSDAAQRAMYTKCKDDNVMEIRRERRIELAFEGFRYDDIRRWDEGQLFRERYEGIYVSELNKPLDITGDGVADIYVGKEGTMPANENRDPNVKYVELTMKNGLTNDTYGRIVPYNEALPAWQDWEYLSALPREELTLNQNLTQNPGWDKL